MKRWESDATLLAPRQLRERAEVLDQLDFHALEWKRAGLEARASALHARLEAANAGVFAAIQQEIDAGACPGLFAKLVKECRNAQGIGYDALDELVSGVLQIDEPEDGPLRAGPESVFYQPTPARHIFALMAAAGIEARDVLVDLGSGLGHVPLLVSACTGSPSVGVELEHAYVASARRCAERLRLKRVRFIEADARDADFSIGTVFYLYTPFTGTVLRAVLDALRDQAMARKIRVCTFGPIALAVGEERWLEAKTPVVANRICVFASRG